MGVWRGFSAVVPQPHFSELLLFLMLVRCISSLPCFFPVSRIRTLVLKRAAPKSGLLCVPFWRGRGGGGGIL